jgi:hypothetical protein
MYFGVNTTSGDGFIQTMRNNTATAYNLILNSAGGNVGIGTTSPTAKLTVRGPSISPEFNTTTVANASILISNSDTDYGTFISSLASGVGIVQQRRYASAVYYDLSLNPYGGNVGIGTTSPGTKLDVAGTIRSLVSGGTPIVYLNNGSTQHSIQNESGAFTFYNSGVERMRLDNSGNLGLGVTPSAWGSDYKAFVFGGSATGSVSYKNFITSLGINFYSTNSNDVALVNGYAAKYELNGSGEHVWKTAAVTGGSNITFTQAMTLTAAGQWLLGGTSLDNPQSWGRIAQVINSGSNGAAISVKDANNEFNIATYNSALIIADGVTERARITSGGDFLLGATSGTGNAERLFVTNAQNNVAIFKGTGGGLAQISVWNDANKGPGIGAYASTYGGGSNFSVGPNGSYISTATGAVFAIGTSDSQPFILGTGNTERMRIGSGGNIFLNGSTVLNGFGSEDVTEIYYAGGSSSYLAINNAGTNAGIYVSISSSASGTGATAFFSFSKTGTQVGTITTNGSATAYNTSSDRRLKDNIAPADNAGSVIDAIEVVKHDWKVGGHTRYGMIAQDLHTVAPEAVSVGDDGEELKTPWGVDYSKLVPMLVKEIQSLRARVAQLESK